MTIRQLQLVLAALFATACAGQGPVDSREQAAGTPLGSALQLPNGLTQRVTLSPASPARGETVTIHSVITNDGSASVTLGSRICGLDYAGSLALTWPTGIGKCAGFSMARELAGGESVEVADLMTVDSPPGDYTLRVRQALAPEAWYELKVTVRPR